MTPEEIKKTVKHWTQYHAALTIALTIANVWFAVGVVGKDLFAIVVGTVFFAVAAVITALGEPNE